MSRTFILASAAAVLIALTGASAQTGAIVEAPSKFLTKEVAKWWHTPKPVAEAAEHAARHLAIHGLTHVYNNGELFKSADERSRDSAQAPNDVISWKTLDGERLRAAIAASGLTAGEPQAPAFK
jgi:hypothetical protein